MKQVFKIESRVHLRSNDVRQVVDYVACDGGIRTAAQKVVEKHMKLRYRDRDNEWSDVVKVVPESATKLCELTIQR